MSNALKMETAEKPVRLTRSSAETSAAIASAMRTLATIKPRTPALMSALDKLARLIAADATGEASCDSAAEANSPANEPNLVAALTTDGRNGRVMKSDREQEDGTKAAQGYF